MDEMVQLVRESRTAMREVVDILREGEEDNIFAYMQSEKYEALLKLQEYMDQPIIMNAESQYIGLYCVNDPKYGNCMLYFGEMKDGLRSGIGGWYCYFQGNSYSSNGNWIDDVPNGTFYTKEWNSSLAEDVVHRIVSGTVSNGLWDGSVLWAFEESGAYKAWNCTFVDGIGQYVSSMETENGIRYYWSTVQTDGVEKKLGPNPETADEKQGIAGFIS